MILYNFILGLMVVAIFKVVYWEIIRFTLTCDNDIGYMLLCWSYRLSKFP